MGLFTWLGIGKKVVDMVAPGEDEPDQPSTGATIATEAGQTIRSFSSKEQGTRRQEIDMLSDNRLSKSVRPLTIIWILVLFTASMIAAWFGKQTPEQYQELIFWSLLAVIGFYFPGRDLVKTFAKNNKRNRK